MRILKKIGDFFSHDLKAGIRNLIVWFPVIWQDRWWDYYFFYRILRHKLFLMEKSFRKHGCSVTSPQEADNMKLCVLLLDRLLKDEYHEMTMKKHDEKWGEAELNCDPLEKNPDLYELRITHKNVKTEKDQEEERKMFKNAIEHEEYLKGQDLDLLFKTMRKYIQGWWD